MKVGILKKVFLVSAGLFLSVFLFSGCNKSVEVKGESKNQLSEMQSELDEQQVKIEDLQKKNDQQREADEQQDEQQNLKSCVDSLRALYRNLAHFQADPDRDKEAIPNTQKHIVETKDQCARFSDTDEMKQLNEESKQTNQQEVNESQGEIKAQCEERKSTCSVKMEQKQREIDEFEKFIDQRKRDIKHINNSIDACKGSSNCLEGLDEGKAKHEESIKEYYGKISEADDELKKIKNSEECRNYNKTCT